MNPIQPKEFSERKHALGEWKTSAMSGSNPVVRALFDYLSMKRRGISALARHIAADSLVLDLGCGNGAYTKWLSSQKPLKTVSVDWSFDALSKRFGARKEGAMRVCADASRLPFRAECFAGAFSIDTLGHVKSQDACADELLRVCRPGARLFIHSECGDYQSRWPDDDLITRLKTDVLAEQDGHINLRPSHEIRAMFARRFHLLWFSSPAGVLGWLFGYPEKYAPAFRQARMFIPWICAVVTSVVKKTPVFGWAMRMLNATTNHLELFLGLEGGGSCFCALRKPFHSDQRTE